MKISITVDLLVLAPLFFMNLFSWRANSMTNVSVKHKLGAGTSIKRERRKTKRRLDRRGGAGRIRLKR